MTKGNRAYWVCRAGRGRPVRKAVATAEKGQKKAPLALSSPADVTHRC